MSNNQLRSRTYRNPVHEVHGYDRSEFNDVEKYTHQDLKAALASPFNSIKRKIELDAEYVRRRYQEQQDGKCVMES